MRKILGGAVLVLGTGALGIWASNDHAERMEDAVEAAAQTAVQDTIHAVDTSVSGRDITVTGLADSAEERDSILAALSDVDGRRVVHDDLDILPTIDPYLFASELNETQQGYRGNVPTKTARQAMGRAIGAAAGQLTLASGAPDQWVEAVSVSSVALGEAKSGTLLIENTSVTLDALVATPVEEEAIQTIMAALPDNYTAAITLDVEDDGTPFRLLAEKTADGTTVNGKLPSEMSADDLVGLGADDLSAVQVARIPSSDGQFGEVVQQGVEGLSLLENGVLDISGNALLLQGEGTRANLAQVEEVLATVPGGYRARVAVAVYDDGEPMSVAAIKDADGVRVVDGKLPFGMDARALGAGGTEVLAQAEIVARASDFEDATQAGLRALDMLDSGALSVDDAAVAGGDAVVTLSGAAQTPETAQAVAAALAGLATPAEVALTTLDDGAPLSLAATKSGDGITAKGKLPASMDVSGVPMAAAGDVANAGIARDIDAPFETAATAGLAALSGLDDGDLTVGEGALMLTGVATRAGKQAAEEALSGAPATWDVQSDISIADDGEPLRLIAGLSDAGVSVSGKVPFGADATTLGLASDSDDLTIAEIDANAESFTDAAAAGLRALGQFEAGTLDVLDASDLGGTPTVRLAGVTSREGEVAAKDALAGYEVAYEITYADDGQPISLSADGSGITGGKLPFGATSGDLGVDSLGNAAIAEIAAQDEGFLTLSARGLAALELVDAGQLTVTDGTPATMTLTGTVDTPADRDAVLAALDDAASAEIATRDDGTPPAFDVRYGASSGAEVSGKLPNGLTLEGLADVLVLDTVAGEPVEGLIGDGGTATPALEALAAWLPDLENASLSFGADGQATLAAEAAPGVDLAVLRDALSADLDGIAALDLSASATKPATGTTRVNAATGVNERYSGFAWLPAYSFDATLDRCNDETVAILARSRINFLTGSAQLDARSVRAVNALSGAVQHCLINDSTFRIEVGGHTDAQGAEDANLALSEERANAVRDALIARGVGPGALTAVGYGESQPIADNETEEGRAENRRTTFSWGREGE